MLLRCVLLATLVALCSGSSLKGHSVLRVVPGTTDQLLAVHKYLESNPQLDVWAEPRKAGRAVDVHVTPVQRQGVVRFLEQQGLEHHEFIEDLDRVAKEQQASVLRRLDSDEALGWTSYYRLEEIYKWMAGLEEQYPGKVSVVDVGQSYEGRSMKGLIIKFDENLPVAMIESGIHAREWIAPASATYFIDQILNSDEADVVRKYEWHIFPSVNPDGYAYTWSKNRNWRKTRSPHWFIFRGVDANRNWPFHWMEAGANKVPYTEIYGGPEAESEVETRNLRQYVDSLASRMHVYISLHSYSQMLMFPWGYTSSHVAAQDKLNAIAAKAVSAVKGIAGKEFEYGNIADTIYPASGNTIDYVYSKCVPFPFVYELRDNGIYGFLLPEDQILDGAREAWAGVRVIAEEAFKDGVPASNPASCPSL